MTILTNLTDILLIILFILLPYFLVAEVIKIWKSKKRKDHNEKSKIAIFKLLIFSLILVLISLFGLTKNMQQYLLGLNSIFLILFIFIKVRKT